MSVIRNQTVTGLPDTSYRKRVSDGKRRGGLFSGTVYLYRPPRYEHVFFLKIVSLKLCRGGLIGKASICLHSHVNVDQIKVGALSF